MFTLFKSEQVLCACSDFFTKIRLLLLYHKRHARLTYSFICTLTTLPIDTTFYELCLRYRKILNFTVFFAEFAWNYPFQSKMKPQNPTSLFRVNHTPFLGNSLTFRVKVWLQSVCQYLFFLPDLLIFAISLNFAFFASRYRLLSTA